MADKKEVTSIDKVKAEKERIAFLREQLSDMGMFRYQGKPLMKLDYQELENAYIAARCGIAKIL
jgi:hypothetical protein